MKSFGKIFFRGSPETDFLFRIFQSKEWIILNIFFIKNKKLMTMNFCFLSEQTVNSIFCSEFEFSEMGKNFKFKNNYFSREERFFFFGWRDQKIF